MSLFWLFGLCLHVWLFDIYESSYAIIHKIGLYKQGFQSRWMSKELICKFRDLKVMDFN